MLEAGTPRQETRRHSERYHSVCPLDFLNVAALPHEGESASFPYGRDLDTKAPTYKVNLSPTAVRPALTVSLNTK